MATAGFAVLVILGVVMLIGAAADWDRLRRDWRSQLVIRLVGVRGARLLQAVVGLLLAGTGLLGLLGGFG